MNNKLSRWIIFSYGIISYFIFSASVLYLMLFVENLFVTRSLDSMREGNLPIALTIDILLLSLFALQHSGMARSGFKEKLTKIIPEPVERSTYVLCSSLCLLTVIMFWQPIGITIWAAENTTLIYSFYALSGLGWIIVFISTFLLNHFDLFGLRQVYLSLIGEDYTHLKFATPGLYKLVRHPLYVGFLLAMWFTPIMTISHLTFSLVLTIYILGAIQLEEKDLVAVHGDDYLEYKNRVPMIIPVLFPPKK